MASVIAEANILFDLQPSQSATAADSSESRALNLSLKPVTTALSLPATLPMISLPSPSKKPKLTLNTNNLPSIFGKSATSLTLETLSATSPTVRNTFQNRAAVQAAGVMSLSIPTQHAALPPRLRTDLHGLDISSEPTQKNSIETLKRVDSLETLSTAYSSASAFSLPLITTRLLPTTTSILKTSGLPCTLTGRLPFSQVWPRKSVSFREELTEEVKNVRYTLRHSDIEETAGHDDAPLEMGSRATKRQSERPSLSNLTCDAAPQETIDASALSSQLSPLKRTASDDLDDDHADDEDNDDTNIAATPIASRAKRHRWTWTLPSFGFEGPCYEAASSPLHTLAGVATAAS